ncbi:MAG: DNA adenine methylase [Hyphomicrobiaceae bacterium]|nr:DNA adenine methylase [Hyphomicrobiaceae bacterium]MCC0024646.1 DNA adenine methylase [Hyphomicrobiaceae bacterium]
MKDSLEPVAPVSTPAPWQGGKRILGSLIAERIAEVPHQIYAEPFVGMGGVFFRRAFRPPAEAINDRNGEVVNLFRVLQVHYTAFIDHMKFQLTSRREFERLVGLDPGKLTELQRAARFLYLQRTSFAGKASGQNFGTTPGGPARFDLTKLAPLLEDIYERLTPVTIENLDWRDFCERYDSPETLFYLDPPYWAGENDYGKGLFDRAQFSGIAEFMRSCDAKMIVSLNDVPEIRETFAGLRFEELTLNYTMATSITGEGKQAKEVLITNFERPSLPLFG